LKFTVTPNSTYKDRRATIRIVTRKGKKTTSWRGLTLYQGGLTPPTLCAYQFDESLVEFGPEGGTRTVEATLNDARCAGQAIEQLRPVGDVAQFLRVNEVRRAGTDLTLQVTASPNATLGARGTSLRYIWVTGSIGREVTSGELLVVQRPPAPPSGAATIGVPNRIGVTLESQALRLDIQAAPSLCWRVVPQQAPNGLGDRYGWFSFDRSDAGCGSGIYRMTVGFNEWSETRYAVLWIYPQFGSASPRTYVILEQRASY